MKKIIYAITFMISTIYYSEVQASTYASTSKIYEVDGVYYKATIYKNRNSDGPGAFSFIKCTDATCKSSEKNLTVNDFNYITYDNDGNIISEYNYYTPRPTYVLNAEGVITGKKNGFEGPLVETYTYTEGGKIIVYDTEGKMKGAYNDLLDYHTDCQGGSDSASVTCRNKFSQYIGNLSLPVNENGEFYDYAEDGKTILGIYATNGDITNYKYDDKGNLLNVTKNGDVIAENKYDAGGNLIASYENGKQTYHRTSYTIKEANDATPNPEALYSIKLKL